MIEEKGGHPPYEKEELIYFSEGLFGFEEYKKFLPLPMEDDNDAVLCLLSVEDENLSFIIMNPFQIMKEYSPVLPEDVYKKLGTSNDEDLSFYVICVVADPAEDSTVNLKCPIVVNTVSRKAVQVILETEEYQFRHALKNLENSLAEEV